MQDHLFYQNNWFDLNDQHLLACSFSGKIKLHRPFVGQPPHQLSDEEYECNWQIKEKKLFLLSVTMDDGSDLVCRLFHESLTPIFAEWYSGLFTATSEPILMNGVLKRRVVEFDVENGVVQDAAFLGFFETD